MIVPVLSSATIWTYPASSRETAVYPGDVLGSGTIGGGAFLEYFGSQPFISAGDVIEMEVEGIGTLRMEVK